MPAPYTHNCFGRDVLSHLPEDLQRRILPHRGLFDIGLQGPDLFFCYQPLVSTPVGRLGRSLHRTAGETVFRRFAALDDGSDEAFAYLAGFLCHFTLDSACHGYVEEMTLLGMSHPLLETQLDRSFLLQDGKDPVRTDPTAQIIPSLHHARVISAFFPQVSRNRMEQVLKQFVFYHRFLLADSRPKRQLLNAAFWIIRAEDSFGAMVITEQALPACQQMVEQLHRLYEEAIPTAVNLIETWPDLRHPHYRLDMDGHEHRRTT